MWYKTDLTETILTSETAGRMAGYVLPVYGRSYIGLWLFQIMGIPFDEILVIAEHFFEEFFPETAVWSLPLWEQASPLLEMAGKLQRNAGNASC